MYTQKVYMINVETIVDLSIVWMNELVDNWNNLFLISN